MATIVLDPGHGGEQSLLGSSANRARGPQGTLEKDLTLAIAEAARDAFGAEHRVVLTRDTDVNLSAADRAAFAKNAEADAFVSVHFNAHPDTSVQGTETLVRSVGAGSLPSVEPRSRRLAEAIQSALVAQLGLPDRGLKPGYWVILNERLHGPNTARCLTEISFLSDPEEEMRLADAGYRQRIGRALAGAIETFLKQPAQMTNAGAVAAVGGGASIATRQFRGRVDPDSYQTFRRSSRTDRYGYNVDEFGQIPEGYLFVDPADMVRGIDVSHHQGAIDWARVAGADIRFAFIKATEGTTFQDGDFAANWRDAGANGIARGAYHLLKPRSSSGVDTQAQNFINIVNLAAGDMPPALDVEHKDLQVIVREEGVAGTSSFIFRWCELVEQATGVQPVLYFSERNANRLNFDFGALPSLELWIPRYRRINRPPPLPLDNNGHLVWPHWSFWQHSETGAVAGIAGNVDLDLFNGNAQHFQQWLQDVQPPAAAPQPAGPPDAAAQALMAEDEGEGDELDIGEPIAVIQSTNRNHELYALDLGPENHAATAGSEHFSLEEFRCRDGTDCPERFRGNLQMLMDSLEVLRVELGGQPITINSGYRTPSYNKKIGGASRSRHMVGMAADLRVQGQSAQGVYDTVERLQRDGRVHAGGLHAYQYTDDSSCDFVHYDVRGRKARWPTKTRVCHKAASAQARPLAVVGPDYTPSGPLDAIRAWIEFFRRYESWRVGVPDTGYFPHSAICKMVMTFSDGKRYGGTGFYIAPDRLLTAAHNVVDVSAGPTATSITITPGLNGSTGAGPAFVVSGAANWKVHPKYDGSFDNDLALIRVSTPPPGGQYFDVLEVLMQSQASPIIVCGYSSETVDSSVQHLDGDRIRWISDSNEVYGYNLQTERGASGAPVFYFSAYEDPEQRMSVQTIPIIGVHVAAGPIPEPKLNRVCRLTEAKASWIQTHLKSW